MEVRKNRLCTPALRLFNDERGYTLPWVLVFLFVFFLVLVFSYDFIRIGQMRTTVKNAVEQSINIAVNVAMEDAHRVDHRSSIKTGLAQQEFERQLKKALSLDKNMTRSDEKGVLVRIEITESGLKARKPYSMVKGIVHVRPLFEKVFQGEMFEIPFEVMGRNIRLE